MSLPDQSFMLLNERKIKLAEIHCDVCGEHVMSDSVTLVATFQGRCERVHDGGTKLDGHLGGKKI